MMLNVAITGRGTAMERTLRVRVPEQELAAALIERGFWSDAPNLEVRAAVRDDLARQHAVRQFWGRTFYWQSGVTRHRGQVWTSAKGGGSNAVTTEFSMRVTW